MKNRLRHAVFLSAEYSYGLQNLSGDLPGHAYNRAEVLTIGYRFFFGSPDNTR